MSTEMTPDDLRLEAELLDALDIVKKKKPGKFVLVVVKNDDKTMHPWWFGLNNIEAYAFAMLGAERIKQLIFK